MKTNDTLILTPTNSLMINEIITPINMFNSRPMILPFQTARGKSVSVSNEAAVAGSLYLDKTVPDDMELIVNMENSQRCS